MPFSRMPAEGDVGLGVDGLALIAGFEDEDREGLVGVGWNREGEAEFAVGAGGGVLAGGFDGDAGDGVVLCVADGALEGSGFGGEAVVDRPSGWDEDGDGCGGDEGVTALVAAALGGEKCCDFGGGIGGREGVDVFEIIGKGCVVETPGEDGLLFHLGDIDFGFDPVGGGSGDRPAEGQEAGFFNGIAELVGPSCAGAEAGGIKEDFEAERVAGLLELAGSGQVFARVTDEGVVHRTRRCSEGKS